MPLIDMENGQKIVDIAPCSVEHRSLLYITPITSRHHYEVAWRHHKDEIFTLWALGRDDITTVYYSAHNMEFTWKDNQSYRCEGFPDDYYVGTLLQLQACSIPQPFTYPIYVTVPPLIRLKQQTDGFWGGGQQAVEEEEEKGNDSNHNVKNEQDDEHDANMSGAPDSEIKNENIPKDSDVKPAWGPFRGPTPAPPMFDEDNDYDQINHVDSSHQSSNQYLSSRSAFANN